MLKDSSLSALASLLLVAVCLVNRSLAFSRRSSHAHGPLTFYPFTAAAAVVGASRRDRGTSLWGTTKTTSSSDAITKKLTGTDVSYVSLRPASVVPPTPPSPPQMQPPTQPTSSSSSSSSSSASSSASSSSSSSSPAASVDGADGFSFSADEMDAIQFGAIFRQCAPYIAMHRGTIMVIHLGGKSLYSRDDFDAVIDDISILHLLGVQLVLVAGVRKQVRLCPLPPRACTMCVFVLSAWTRPLTD